MRRQDDIIKGSRIGDDGSRTITTSRSPVEYKILTMWVDLHEHDYPMAHCNTPDVPQQLYGSRPWESERVTLSASDDSTAWEIHHPSGIQGVSKSLW